MTNIKEILEKLLEEQNVVSKESMVLSDKILAVIDEPPHEKFADIIEALTTNIGTIVMSQVEINDVPETILAAEALCVTIDNHFIKLQEIMSGSDKVKITAKAELLALAHCLHLANKRYAESMLLLEKENPCINCTGCKPKTGYSQDNVDEAILAIKKLFENVDVEVIIHSVN